MIIYIPVNHNNNSYLTRKSAFKAPVYSTPPAHLFKGLTSTPSHFSSNYCNSNSNSDSKSNSNSINSGISIVSMAAPPPPAIVPASVGGLPLPCLPCVRHIISQVSAWRKVVVGAGGAVAAGSPTPMEMCLICFPNTEFP